MPERLIVSDPSRLAPLLARRPGGLDSSPSWGPGELAAVLRHQLAAPVRLDLGNRLVALSRELCAAGTYRGLADRTFGELLHDPAAPVEAIELVKRFAKAHRTRIEPVLPREVATVLYYAAIRVAWARCGVRISGLDEAAIREGASWAVAQDWVDESTKMLLR